MKLLPEARRDLINEKSKLWMEMRADIDPSSFSDVKREKLWSVETTNFTPLQRHRAKKILGEIKAQPSEYPDSAKAYLESVLAVRSDQNTPSYWVGALGSTLGAVALGLGLAPIGLPLGLVMLGCAGSGLRAEDPIERSEAGIMVLAGFASPAVFGAALGSALGAGALLPLSAPLAGVERCTGLSDAEDGLTPINAAREYVMSTYAGGPDYFSEPEPKVRIAPSSAG